MGYRFQFVALAGFQSLNQGMFELARGYRESGMAALTRLQQAELELAQISGYEAIKPQRFVGAGYFDDVAQTIAGVSPSSTEQVRLTEEEKRALVEWASAQSKAAN
jgi:isocitrate lyase